METRKIGALDVTVVGLGCNNFGRRLDPEATARVLHAAIDAGINFFDTADIYGGTKSEEYMGRALKGKWDKVVLATKFGGEVDPLRTGANPAYVKQAVEDSLRRLNADHIDLYQLHRPDPEVPIADTLEALDELVKAGKVREIGCSNFSAEQLREAEAAVEQGAARFVSVQNEYSLLKRDPEKEVLPECDNLGLAFLPYFPLASGLLSGKYRKGQPFPEGTRIAPGSDQLSPEKLEFVEKLTTFAEQRDHTLLELAISWLLAHKEVASVIAGATRPEQVDNNARAGRWKLTAEDLSELDHLSNTHAVAGTS